MTRSPLTLLFAAAAVATLLMIAAVDLAVVLGSGSTPGQDVGAALPSAVPSAASSSPGSPGPHDTSPPKLSTPPTPPPPVRSSPVSSSPPPPSSTPAPAPVTSVPSPPPVPVPPTAPAPTPGPTRDALAIPDQHVVAPIEACRVVDRALLPPADPQRTCYWAAGAGLSASTGTTVLVGEPDWIDSAPSALGQVSALRPGEEIITSDATGAVTDWQVVRVGERAKRDGVDPAAFVGTSGPRRLYLITAGGPYDAAQRTYLDNIYVLAVPRA